MSPTVEPALLIAVSGPGQATAQECRLAEEVGELVARAGATLLSGGRGGVMEASCRGAVRAGGVTIGLLPGSNPADGNGWLTYCLPTGVGEHRDLLLVQAADALIVIGDSAGTRIELNAALKRHRRPVVVSSDALVPTGAQLARTPAEAVTKAHEQAQAYRGAC